jgi:hypothetical protein
VHVEFSRNSGGQFGVDSSLGVFHVKGHHG